MGLTSLMVRNNTVRYETFWTQRGNNKHAIWHHQNEHETLNELQLL